MASPIKFTPTQSKSIITMFVDERVSTTVIGRKYGVTCNTIIKHLRNNGVPVDLSDRRTIQFTEDARQDIVCRYDEGYGESTVQIGKVYGCSYATIRRVLKEEGVYTPGIPHNRIYFTDGDIAEILRLYGDGASANSISKEFGCGDGVILSVLREQGIDTNDYGRGDRQRTIWDTGQLKTCRSLTRRMYLNHKSTINPKLHRISKYGHHLDHKMSLSDGFNDGDLTILDLAHPCNLQVISAGENLSKYVKSDLSKRELLNAIKVWNRELGDPFASVDMQIEYTYRYNRYRYFGGEYRYNWGVR